MNWVARLRFKRKIISFFEPYCYIWIWFRYVTVTVPLLFKRYRDRASATGTDRYWPLRTVSHRDRTLHALQNVTERYKRYRALQSVTERFIFYLNKKLKWAFLKLIYCLSIKLLFANMFISFLFKFSKNHKFRM